MSCFAFCQSFASTTLFYLEKSKGYLNKETFSETNIVPVFLWIFQMLQILLESKPENGTYAIIVYNRCTNNVLVTFRWGKQRDLMGPCCYPGDQVELIISLYSRYQTYYTGKSEGYCIWYCWYHNTLVKGEATVHDTVNSYTGRQWRLHIMLILTLAKEFYTLYTRPVNPTTTDQLLLHQLSWNHLRKL